MSINVFCAECHCLFALIMKYFHKRDQEFLDPEQDAEADTRVVLTSLHISSGIDLVYLSSIQQFDRQHICSARGTGELDDIHPTPHP